MRHSWKIVLCAVLLRLFVASPLPARAEVSFVHDIAPIVLKRCTGCHGERTNLGGYRAHTFEALIKKGASGKAAIVPGKPDESPLFQRITTKVEALRMPKSDDPLSSAQIALVRKWILSGAKFDGPDITLPLKNLLGPRQHPASPIAYRAAAPVMALAFAPGGKELFVGGYNEVTVWNADTGALIRRLSHLPQRIQALAFSKDGKILLVAGGTPGEYGEVALVNMVSGERKVLDTFNDIVLAAVFSQDAKWIVAGGADGSVRLYETASGKRLWVSKVHSDWVTGVSVSFDNKFVASASKDMTVKIYEAETGTLFATYNGHNRQIGQYKGQAPVYAVQFAPDTPLGYSAGGGKWIQIWDPIKTKEEAGDAGDMEDRFAKQGHARYIAHGFEQAVFALSVQPEQIFAASADGILKQFDRSTGKEIRAYKGHSDWVYALNYDAASQRVATGSYDGEVRVWNTQTGQCLLNFKAIPGRMALRP